MKAQLVEVKERNVIKYDKRTDVYTNGADNAYPVRMERVVSSSITARSCALMYQLFLMGTGLKADNKLPIGKYQAKNINANQLLKLICRDISYHNGFFLHINYNLLGQKTTISPLMYKNCRFGKEDSEEYKGKIVYYNNWDGQKGRVMTKDFKVFNVYNPDPAIVMYQIQKAGGIDKYTGQVAFFSFDDYGIYPLSPIDPAQDDADSEYQFSVLKNRTLSKGFIGKNVIAAGPFASDDDREDFRKKVKNIQGVDSDNDILIVEREMTSDLAPNNYKSVEITQLGTLANFSRDYGGWEESIANNIRKCFKFVPPVLIEFVEGKLGNTSADSFLMAQKFYNAQTRMDRIMISELLQDLFSNFYKPVTNDWSIGELQLMTADPSPVNTPTN